MSIMFTFYDIQKACLLFLKSMLSQVPLFLPHIQLLLHCTFRQDYLPDQPGFPLDLQIAYWVVSELREKREKLGCSTVLEAAPTEPVRKQQASWYSFQQKNPVWESPCFVSDNHKGFYPIKRRMCLMLFCTIFLLLQVPRQTLLTWIWNKHYFASLLHLSLVVFLKWE